MRYHYSNRNKLHETIRKLKVKRKRQAYWPEGYWIVCDTCREENFAERNVKYRQEEIARRKRLEQLGQMPYVEYLKNLEWQERRCRNLISGEGVAKFAMPKADG